MNKSFIPIDILPSKLILQKLKFFILAKAKKIKTLKKSNFDFFLKLTLQPTTTPLRNLKAAIDFLALQTIGFLLVISFNNIIE